MNKVVNVYDKLYSMENYPKKLADRYSELIGFRYDHNAKSTRNIEHFVKDKKGVCFDFVNYIYHKNNKKGKCYFIHYNNRIHNTHTFYISDDGYYIEATPPNDILKHIYIEKITVDKLVKRLVQQNVDFDNLDQPDDPPFDLVEYTPDNREITISDFINNMFDKLGVEHD